ncbi:hypothetical protein M405DRAFT_805232 [Rhizopogon salebrosus TDB-379]|nr:hypothetical protein M405DRAFT_805232 [Rhizopogon salebrosus TDB-379]
MKSDIIHRCSHHDAHAPTPPFIFYLSESVLPIWSSSAQSQHSQPDVCAPELFVLLHNLSRTRSPLSRPGRLSGSQWPKISCVSLKSMTTLHPFSTSQESALPSGP